MGTLHRPTIFEKRAAPPPHTHSEVNINEVMQRLFGVGTAGSSPFGIDDAIADAAGARAHTRTHTHIFWSGELAGSIMSGPSRWRKNSDSASQRQSSGEVFSLGVFKSTVNTVLSFLFCFCFCAHLSNSCPTSRLFMQRHRHPPRPRIGRRTPRPTMATVCWPPRRQR